MMGTKSPVPSSNKAVTFPVVLFLVPAPVPATLTEKEQELDGGRLNAEMPIVVLPGLATISPPQLPARPLGLATTRPVGKASLAETFIKVRVVFGLVNVNVREVVPFSGMLEAPNALAIVAGNGAGTTVRLAVLLAAPGPLSLEVIGPVVLSRIPKAAGALTSTVIKQVPAAGLVA